MEFQVVRYDSTSAGVAGQAESEILQGSVPVQPGNGPCFVGAQTSAAAAGDGRAVLASPRPRLAGEGLGGELGNTAPQTVKGEKKNEKEEEGEGGRASGLGQSWQGGYDYLEFSLKAEWGSAEQWEELCGRLERGKEAARSQGQGGAGCGPLEPFVEIGGVQFWVQPTGYRGWGFSAAWRLKVKGIEIGIANDPQCFRGSNVKVVLSSYVLMLHGLLGVLDQVATALRLLGAEADVWAGTVGRADWCVDCAGVRAHDLIDAWVSGCCVARPTKGFPVMEDGVWQSLRVGKDNLVRIYDKLLESENDEDKRAILIRDRWGGVLPESATRVEYQLRGSMLRELCVVSLRDLVDKQGEIVAYLTQHWFRLTEGVPDRENGNQARSVMHPTWDAVVTAFSRVFGEAPVAERVHPRASRESFKRLQQIIGNALSCVAIDCKVGFKPRHELESEVRKVFFRALDAAFRTSYSGKVQASFERKVNEFDCAGRGVEFCFQE